MPLPQQPMQVKQCTKKSIVQVKKKFFVLILIFEIILVFGMTLVCMIILTTERKGEKGKLTEFFCTW